MLVFVVLHQFVAHDIQRRSDAWLSGEVHVLGDVALRTPKDRLYRRVVGEVAELASREVPNKLRNSGPENASVFFLQTGQDGSPKLWVGTGTGAPMLRAIRATKIIPDVPSDLRVNGFEVPFRIVSVAMEDGSHIYLALSEHDELRVLRNLRWRFLILWLLIVFFGFAIVFYTTRRMLGSVRQITEAASKIGQSDLSRRVPITQRNDEVAQLAFTLNQMLDRIENSMHQLHTITDSLAHDLRSPLTAIRGKLETFLSDGARSEQRESIAAAIDELDRLTEFLNTSLDVAEAKAGALRLSCCELDLDELLRVMIDLYEPSMSDKGLHIQLRSMDSVKIHADAALMHRMVANIFDNELKHLAPSCTVSFGLRVEANTVVLVIEDDGLGFDAELGRRIFERGVKGKNSSGRGLGLAFVEAVARAHGGTVTASNRPEGGARLSITLPCRAEEQLRGHQPMTLAVS
jgi:signal transduction histidine kinase